MRDSINCGPFIPSAQCYPYQHLHTCHLGHTCRHPLDSTYAFPNVAGTNSYSRLLSISINAVAGALPTGSLMCHCRDYTACISTIISLALHMSLSCHCPIALFSDSLTEVLQQWTLVSKLNSTGMLGKDESEWSPSPVGVSEQPSMFPTINQRGVINAGYNIMQAQKMH